MLASTHLAYVVARFLRGAIAIIISALFVDERPGLNVRHKLCVARIGCPC